jgi:ribosomal protein S18 acetylase RimI-like enzyme
VLLAGIPIFATASIADTLRFYGEVLGFAVDWTYGEPATFASVSWGGATVMFNLQPELAASVRGHQHWFKVEDVDALYARHLERGAHVVSPIQDKPWGAREYILEDPSGYHLRFAGSPVSQAPTSAEPPAGLRVERRLPSAEEYATLAGAEFYADRPIAHVLPDSWGGVVAVSADREAVGMARIVRDAPGWYSVWDVAVLPDWRGRRIGDALMREVLATVREVDSGANVFLFTAKYPFYEKLGFHREIVCMRQASPDGLA